MTLYSGDEDYGDEITSPEGEADRGMAEAMKLGSCWLCDGTGIVEVERDRYGHPVTQVCMACVRRGVIR